MVAPPAITSCHTQASAPPPCTPTGRSCTTVRSPVASRSWTSSRHCSQAWKRDVVGRRSPSATAASPCGSCRLGRPVVPVRAVGEGEHRPERPLLQRAAALGAPRAGTRRRRGRASKARAQRGQLGVPGRVAVDRCGVRVERAGVVDPEVERVAEPAGGRQVGAGLLRVAGGDGVQRVEHEEPAAARARSTRAGCAGRRGRRRRCCRPTARRRAAPPSPSRARAGSTQRPGRHDQPALDAGVGGERRGSRTAGRRARRRRAAPRCRPRTRTVPCRPVARPRRVTTGAHSSRSAGGRPISSRTRATVSSLVALRVPVGVDVVLLDRPTRRSRRSSRGRVCLGSRR